MGCSRRDSTGHCSVSLCPGLPPARAPPQVGRSTSQLPEPGVGSGPGGRAGCRFSVATGWALWWPQPGECAGLGPPHPGRGGRGVDPRAGWAAGVRRTALPHGCAGRGGLATSGRDICWVFGVLVSLEGRGGQEGAAAAGGPPCAPLGWPRPPGSGSRCSINRAPTWRDVGPASFRAAEPGDTRGAGPGVTPAWCPPPGPGAPRAGGVGMQGAPLAVCRGCLRACGHRGAPCKASTRTPATCALGDRPGSAWSVAPPAGQRSPTALGAGRIPV